MNISYNWLKEYVDFTLMPDEVAEALTSIGLEVGSVEEVQSIRGGLKGIVTAEVLTCEMHPNSDHLHVCSVNLGEGQVAQIVCGAPNVAAGQKVVVATVGTTLYDGDKEFVIKKSKLRGVESHGMICAEDEIGVGTNHDGIIVLPADTPVGMPAATYYNLESDYVIEVDITPNRADACSHYGVARDLYAYLVRHGVATSLHRPSADAFTVASHSLPIDIVVENSEACPRYCGVTVKGCKVGESPEWLKRKLSTIGCRPINNVVDVTNYILFAYGQPLHCFDADMIAGGRVVVKTLPEGTPFQTLDGEERKLSANDLAICNAEAPMCIAGVFGGKGSGTYETTTDVLLESAYFHPTWIRKSARRHGLATDASFRFERGVDPDGQIYALKQAAILVAQLTGGEVAMDICDIEAPGLTKWFDVRLEWDYVDGLIGKHIERDLAKRILTALEMVITAEDEQGLTLKVPAYRVDVQRPCDVVEDLLRIYGYNSVEIPTAVKSCLNIKGDDDRSHKLQNLIAEQLTGQGFREILNNSLTREAYYQGFENELAATRLVHVMNPLSSDLNVLRGTMLFGGLETIARNANRKQGNLRLYEFGKCYHFDESRRTEGRTLSAYSEENHLALWMTGKRVEGSWAHADEAASVFELKACVEHILTRIGVNTQALVFTTSQTSLSATAMVITDRNGKAVGEYGIVRHALHPQVAGDVYYADLHWDVLMRLSKKNVVTYAELSKFPAVSRDLALLVDKAVTFAEIEKVARSAERKLLKSVSLFDVYEGKNLEPGKKSYAVNFVLMDDTKTMNDKQTDAIMQKIVAAMQKQLGAILR